MNRCVIGFDISKEKVNYCLTWKGAKVQEGEISNNVKQLKVSINKMTLLAESLAGDEKYSISAVMEYTGLYNNLLVAALTKAEVEIHVEHPKNIKSASGIDRLKNDKVDAQKIAEYGYRFADKLKAWKPIEDNLQKIKILSAKRDQLIKGKNALTQGIKDFKKFHGDNYIQTCTEIDKQTEDFFEEQIKQIEKQIKRLIDQDIELKTNYELIQTVPGIGPVTAIALLILSGNGEKFENAKQLACYCGIAPFERSSGAYKGKARVSHAANKKVKTLLHMCAVTMTRSNSLFGKWYRKKVSEGKNPMSVLNALRNKILNTAFAVMKNKKRYSAGYIYEPAAICG